MPQSNKNKLAKVTDAHAKQLSLPMAAREDLDNRDNEDVRMFTRDVCMLGLHLCKERDMQNRQNTVMCAHVPTLCKYKNTTGMTKTEFRIMVPLVRKTKGEEIRQGHNKLQLN